MKISFGLSAENSRDVFRNVFRNTRRRRSVGTCVVLYSPLDTRPPVHFLPCDFGPWTTPNVHDRETSARRVQYTLRIRLFSFPVMRKRSRGWPRSLPPGHRRRRFRKPFPFATVRTPTMYGHCSAAQHRKDEKRNDRRSPRSLHDVRESRRRHSMRPTFAEISRIIRWYW